MAVGSATVSPPSFEASRTHMSERRFPLYDDLPTEPSEIFERILDHERRGQDLVRLYHQLREVAPVYHSEVERVGRPWILTRYEDITLAAREKGLVKDERLVDQLGGRADSSYKQLLTRMMAFIPPPRRTAARTSKRRTWTVSRWRPVFPKSRSTRFATRGPPRGPSRSWSSPTARRATGARPPTC